MNVPITEGSGKIFQVWDDVDERVRVKDRKWIGVFRWNGSSKVLRVERYRTQVLSEAERQHGKDAGERAFCPAARF